MRTFAVGRWDGIDTSTNEFFPSMPHFADPEELLDVSANHFEGDGIGIELDTTANRVQGEHRWIGKFIWRCLTHSEQRILFARQQRSLGSARSFWMPSWRSDFRITRDVQPVHRNILFVEPNSQFEFVYEDSRYGVYLLSDDQLLHVWQITGYDPVKGELQLSAQHGLLLPKRNIQMCGLVRRVRFRADKFQWSFSSDPIAEVPAEVIECVNEGAFAAGPAVP